MKLTKIAFIFIALCLIQVQAPITIDIEPEDFQQCSEILAQCYLFTV